MLGESSNIVLSGSGPIDGPTYSDVPEAMIPGSQTTTPLSSPELHEMSDADPHTSSRTPLLRSSSIESLGHTTNARGSNLLAASPLDDSEINPSDYDLRNQSAVTYAHLL